MVYQSRATAVAMTFRDHFRKRNLVSPNNHRATGSITFSRREKVPEGRMRGLLPEGIIPSNLSFDSCSQAGALLCAPTP